jgi:hypothetical protein
VVYVPEQCRDEANVRFEIQENKLVRTRSVESEGRVIEKKRDIDGRFVCISTEPLADWTKQGRWLTVNLHNPTGSAPTGLPTPVRRADFAVWHEVQNLVLERAQNRVILPDWEDVILEKACENEYSRRHIPAFLTVWKTMSLLRSFASDDADNRGKYIHGNFESFAATGSLLRKVSREIHLQPEVGDQAEIISPVTGKGLKYVHRTIEHQVQYHS